MRFRLFTIILTACLQVNAWAMSGLNDDLIWSCEAATTNSPDESLKNALVLSHGFLIPRDPRDIVSFGAGTRDEYVEQIVVANSLVGKRISKFWALGPDSPLEPIYIEQVNLTYKFGDKGYDRIGVTLEFHNKYATGIVYTASLWDLLLFQDFIEDWTPPTVRRDSPSVATERGIDDLNMESKAQMLKEGLLPAVGMKINFAENSPVNHWIRAFNAHIYMAQFLNLKTGAAILENKLLANKKGEPVLLYGLETSSLETEANVNENLKYFARKKISEDSKTTPGGGLDSTGIMRFMVKDKVFDPENFGLNSYLKHSLEKHGGSLELTNTPGLPQVVRAENGKYKIVVGPKTEVSDLMMAWTEFILKSER